MNFLNGYLLVRRANVFPPTRWYGNSILQLIGSNVKYLSCNECRYQTINEKSSVTGVTSHGTIPYRVRCYSLSGFEKIREYIKIKSMEFHRFNRRRRLALTLYRTLDTVNFQEFYDFLQLPDTFYSWFVVTELHMWMMMSQLMDGQKSNLNLRNYLVEVMWLDVDERCRNLGPVQRKKIKKQLTELYERFPITLLLYDEGLLSSDIVLAAALWYKFFEKQCDDPIKLEVLVSYIRHQVQHLSSLELKDFYATDSVIENVWLPFSHHVEAVTAL